jgi:alpha-ketoglutarate-dependent 2,4-dichlorophenoxyacetate dioxygenase
LPQPTFKPWLSEASLALDAFSGGLARTGISHRFSRIVQLANQLWHTDSSFKPVPAMASLLSGREVPPAGGETEFVSMRRTWDALPEAMRARLEGRVVVHSILYSRSTIAPGLFDPEHERGLPPVRQALVRANPVNGRRTIYIGSHAWYIEGVDYAKSRRILDELLALTTQPERVYQHRWRQWDLVMGQPLRAPPRPALGLAAPSPR